MLYNFWQNISKKQKRNKVSINKSITNASFWCIIRVVYYAELRNHDPDHATVTIASSLASNFPLVEIITGTVVGIILLFIVILGFVLCRKHRR